MSKYFKIIIFKLFNIYSNFIIKKKLDLKDINIAILLQKPLGLGDLVMLSPFIKLLEHNLNNNIYIISEYNNFIEYKRIAFLKPTNIDDKLLQNSIVISPTLVFSHLKYIFKAKYFIGYFGSNKLISNFLQIDYKYNPKIEHYLEKTFPILESLNIEFDKSNFEYPNIKSKNFNLNIDKGYICVVAYSNWKERQYSKENYIKLINTLLNTYNYQIVLIGSSAIEEKKFNKDIEKSISNNNITNLTGKTSILEMNYIIKNSKLFIGNDSGPANIAYIIAPKSLVFFGSVYFENRLPLNKEFNSNILALDSRNSCSIFPCYDGYNKPYCMNADKYSCLDVMVLSDTLNTLIGDEI